MVSVKFRTLSCRRYMRPYKHVHCMDTHIAPVIVWFGGGGALGTLQSSNLRGVKHHLALRCSTFDLLPPFSTPLIDALCALITPRVIKQHFSQPVSGWRH